MSDDFPLDTCAEQAAPQRPTADVTPRQEAPLVTATRATETNRQLAAGGGSSSVSGRLARLLERKLGRTLSWL